MNLPSAARVIRQRATSTFRLNIDTNRYSVPAEYAGHSLDAHQMNAHSSVYIINLLSQRTRLLEEPGPLHLTRPGDQLEIDLPPADLSVYDEPDPRTQKGVSTTNQQETNTNSDE